jgi:hypothetical protein
VDAAAVVDTEDARFWRHGGVDWLAVARAAARDLERGRVVEGGSTITQQDVKNTYVSGERTLRPDTSLVKVAGDVERGCLPNRLRPPAQVASVVYLRASAPPGRVWRSGPAPGAQSPTASPARLWVDPPHCPSPTTTPTS